MRLSYELSILYSLTRRTYFEKKKKYFEVENQIIDNGFYDQKKLYFFQ